MSKKKLCTLDEEKFRELEKTVRGGYEFSREDNKNQFSKSDIVIAGALAFEIMGEEGNVAEFFNIVLNILYGTLEFGEE
jgi:hypothetical protein